MITRRLVHHYHLLEKKFQNTPEVQVLLIEDANYDCLIVRFRASDFRVYDRRGFAPCSYTYNLFTKPDVFRERHGFSVDNLVKLMSAELGRRLRAGGIR